MAPADTKSSLSLRPETLWRLCIDYKLSLRQKHIDELKACVKFDALCEYATTLRSGVRCKLSEHQTSGSNFYIRTIVFDDGITWIAKIAYHSDDALPKVDMMRSEIDTMNIVRANGLPVPAIYGWDLYNSTIGRPFMLMEFLQGHAIVDIREISKKRHDLFPNYDEDASYPDHFLRAMADFQVRMTRIRFPRIGAVSRDENGEIFFTPPPGMPNIYKTGRAYLEDWADMLETKIKEPSYDVCCYDDDIDPVKKAGLMKTMRQFPADVRQIAQMLPTEEEESFPLCHINLVAWNILVDDKLNLVGVIDWKQSWAHPWLLVDPPDSVRCVLPGDEAWPPERQVGAFDKYIKRKRQDYDRYVQYVEEVERELGSDNQLSTALKANAHRRLTSAMGKALVRRPDTLERAVAVWLKRPE